MTTFKDIDTLFTSTIRDIERPTANHPLNLHSPAMQVFTDFKEQQPLMLEQSTTIDGAREVMKRTHSKLFLVIDPQESFRGVISLEDLVSEKVMRESGHARLRWSEMTVEQVMTPRHRLRALDFCEFRLANVGEVLATMKKFGEHHLIVVDTQNRSLRGIVSAHSIARRMHEPVLISERAVSFSDIYRTIAG
ncbi:MAG: CBS domain-containing protein [Halioglobus sp.]